MPDGTAATAPLVGLSTYREPARWGVWDQRADLLPATYADAIGAAGAVPLLLPPGAPGRAATAVARLDGLVITGGADVDPRRYGAPAHACTDAPREDRDAWELALLDAALARDLPLLGICRGLQLINVALGGDLVQHLPDTVGHDGHCHVAGTFGVHPVRLAEGSRVAAVAGVAATVPTHHHQALGRLADGVVATGWSEDGTVEAFELPAARWAVGVQWHPEVDGGAPLFAAFVAACSGTAG